MSCGGQSVPLFTRDWNRLTMPGPQDPQDPQDAWTGEIPESLMSLIRKYVQWMWNVGVDSWDVDSEYQWMWNVGVDSWDVDSSPNPIRSLLCDIVWLCVCIALIFWNWHVQQWGSSYLISSDSQAMTDSTLQGSYRTTKIAINKHWVVTPRPLLSTVPQKSGTAGRPDLARHLFWSNDAPDVQDQQNWG